MNSTDTPFETWTIPIEADTRQFQAEIKNVTNLGRQFSSTLIGAFEGIAIKGRALATC